MLRRSMAFLEPLSVQLEHPGLPPGAEIYGIYLAALARGMDP